MINYLSLSLSLHFLYILCITHVVIKLILATVVQSMLNAMAAGDASQTAPVQFMHVFTCFRVVLHKLSMCNFDSCKCLTSHMEIFSCNNLVSYKVATRLIILIWKFLVVTTLFHTRLLQG